MYTFCTLLFFLILPLVCLSRPVVPSLDEDGRPAYICNPLFTRDKDDGSLLDPNVVRLTIQCTGFHPRKTVSYHPLSIELSNNDNGGRHPRLALNGEELESLVDKYSGSVWLNDDDPHNDGSNIHTSAISTPCASNQECLRPFLRGEKVPDHLAEASLSKLDIGLRPFNFWDSPKVVVPVDLTIIYDENTKKVLYYTQTLFTDDHPVEQERDQRNIGNPLAGPLNSDERLVSDSDDLKVVVDHDELDEDEWNTVINESVEGSVLPENIVEDTESAPTADNVDVDAELEPATLEEEIALLRDLEDLVEEIKTRVQLQKEVVNNLSDDQYEEAAKDLRQCSNFGCYVKLAFVKAKHGLHLAYLKFGPRRDRKLFATAPTSQLQQALASPNGMQAFAQGGDGTKCSADHAGDAFHDANGYYSQIHAEHSTAFLVLDTIAGLICLSCLLSCFRKCCNPRARAERAALREQRQAEREYRSLARRHAWRSFWGKLCMRRKDRERITDYEEKRALVLNQESALESAMQSEIHRLCPDGQRRAPSPSSMSRAETLPAYRSRASSSGRPPSYHSVEEPSETASDIDVVDGFASYEPSGMAAVDDPNESLPDTSIPNLSPRQSFETLKSERSVV